jgi:hypothetical protein
VRDLRCEHVDVLDLWRFGKQLGRHGHQRPAICPGQYPPPRVYRVRPVWEAGRGLIVLSDLDWLHGLCLANNLTSSSARGLWGVGSS